MNLENSSKWRVASSRITVFPTPDQGVRENIFSLFDSDFEIEVFNKAQHMRTEEGNLGDAWGKVTTNHFRYDLIRTVIPNSEIYLGHSLQEEIDKLNNIWKNFTSLENPISCYRIAVGMNIHLPTNSRAESYAWLNEKLDFFTLSEVENVENLFLQINQPIMVEIDSKPIKLNRLSKYCATARTSFHTEDSGFISPKIITDNSVSIELDFNTDSETTKEFTHSNLNQAIESLIGGITEYIKSHD